MKRLALLLAALTAVPFAAASAAEEVGHATIVLGAVTGTADGVARPLSAHDHVTSNERIATEAGGRSRVVFLDGSQLAIGPKSQIVLDEMVYDPRPERAHLALGIIAGTAKFVSGGFGSAAYRITMPDAALTLHGTSVVCSVGPEEVGGRHATTCTVRSGEATMHDLVTGETFLVRAGETRTVPPWAAGNDRGEVARQQLAALDEVLGPDADPRPRPRLRSLFPDPQQTSSGGGGGIGIAGFSFGQQPASPTLP